MSGGITAESEAAAAVHHCCTEVDLVRVLDVRGVEQGEIVAAEVAARAPEDVAVEHAGNVVRCDRGRAFGEADAVQERRHPLLGHVGRATVGVVDPVDRHDARHSPPHDRPWSWETCYWPAPGRVRVGDVGRPVSRSAVELGDGCEHRQVRVGLAGPCAQGCDAGW